MYICFQYRLSWVILHQDNSDSVNLKQKEQKDCLPFMLLIRWSSMARPIITFYFPLLNYMS